MGETSVERFLFGGTISSHFPLRFQDISDFRQVPDHQETFADADRDESILFELLDLKNDVADYGSAAWFLRDLATEQDAEENLVIEHSGPVETVSLHSGYPPATITTAVGQMVIEENAREGSLLHSRTSSKEVSECLLASKRSGLVFRYNHQNVPSIGAVKKEAVSKGKDGNDARNIVRVFVANVRLKEVATDVLITANEPISINPLSGSAKTVRAGPAVPAVLSGCLPVAEVFKFAVTSFKVHDWDLFGAGS